MEWFNNLFCSDEPVTAPLNMESWWITSWMCLALRPFVINELPYRVMRGPGLITNTSHYLDSLAVGSSGGRSENVPSVSQWLSLWSAPVIFFLCCFFVANRLPPCCCGSLLLPFLLQSEAPNLCLPPLVCPNPPWLAGTELDPPPLLSP